MATAKNIDLKSLVLTICIVAVVEVGLKWVVTPDQLHPVAFLGVARLLEILLLLILIHFSCAKGLASIGIRRHHLKAGLRKGAGWSAGFGAITALVFIGIFLLTGFNPLEHINARLPASMGGVFLFFLVGGMISPVAEEIVFRGVFYGYLRRWGVWAAVLISALVFVLAHTTGRQIPIPQIVGGIVFALAYEKERNLVVPMVIHILGNLAIFTIALF